MSQIEETTTPSPTQIEAGGTESGAIRKIVWEGSIKVWERYPLFGSGVETFAYSYYLDRPAAHNLVSEWDFLYNKAHNEFLNFLATTGAVGFLTYVALLGYFFGRVTSVFLIKKTPDLSTADRMLIISMGAGIAAQSVSNFFGFSTVMVTILLFVFFAITEVILAASSVKPLVRQTPQVHRVIKLSLAQEIGVGTTILIFGSLLLSIYRYWMADVAYAQSSELAQSGDYIGGFEQLQVAITAEPNEPIYYDEMAATLAPLAVSVAQANDATAAAELATNAVAASDIALSLNPYHLNFYKTRTRVLITLAELDPSLLEPALSSLEEAIRRAPTDAKLYYNKAVVELSLKKNDEARASFEKAVTLKSNYIDARFELGKLYEANGQFEAAKVQYRFILENLTPDNPPVADRLEALKTQNPDSQ